MTTYRHRWSWPKTLQFIKEGIKCMRVKEFTMLEAPNMPTQLFSWCCLQTITTVHYLFYWPFEFLHQINPHTALCPALPFHHLNHAAWVWTDPSWSSRIFKSYHCCHVRFPDSWLNEFCSPHSPSSRLNRCGVYREECPKTQWSFSKTDWKTTIDKLCFSEFWTKLQLLVYYVSRRWDTTQTCQILNERMSIVYKHTLQQEHII